MHSCLRGGNPGAVHLHRTLLPDQTELKGVPVKPPHPFQLLFALHRVADPAILGDRIGKALIGKHRQVPQRVMQNVRLRDVVHRLAAAQPGRGRELPRLEHLEKCTRRHEAGDRLHLPSGALLQPSRSPAPSEESAPAPVQARASPPGIRGRRTAPIAPCAVPPARSRARADRGCILRSPVQSETVSPRPARLCSKLRIAHLICPTAPGTTI